jgi:hypothetical protein
MLPAACSPLVFRIRRRWPRFYFRGFRRVTLAPGFGACGQPKKIVPCERFFSASGLYVTASETTLAMRGGNVLLSAHAGSNGGSMEDYMTLPQRAKYRNDWEDAWQFILCEVDAIRMLNAMV